MNNDFEEKLRRYKEGSMNESEVAEIESEIEKHTALLEHLTMEDEAFITELKQEMPVRNNEAIPAKQLKRNVNKRIIMMTAISVVSILITLTIIKFLTTTIAAELFELDHKEAYVERATIVQLTEMFYPQYESRGSGVEQFQPTQQNISVSLGNIVGNTMVEETEVNVRYSFGKPVIGDTTTEGLPLLEAGFFSLMNQYDTNDGFDVLENAPAGTKAKIVVKFNEGLSTHQSKELKKDLLTQINNLDVIPLVAIGEEFVVANPSYYAFTPIYPYDNRAYYEEASEKQNQYEDLDDETHTESFIRNLNLIKDNQELVHVMFNAYEFANMDINKIIDHVESNGIEYIGMYLTADSKEMLTLKDNPLIDRIWVQNIVVW